MSIVKEQRQRFIGCLGAEYKDLWELSTGTEGEDNGTSYWLWGEERKMEDAAKSYNSDKAQVY